MMTTILGRKDDDNIGVPISRLSPPLSGCVMMPKGEGDPSGAIDRRNRAPTCEFNIPSGWLFNTNENPFAQYLS